MNKTSEKFNPVLMDWMFAREVMRRFGFTADEIFFDVFASGVIVTDGAPVDLKMPAIAVTVVRGGERFCWPIGGIDLPIPEIHRCYVELCAAWNADRFGFTHGDFLSSKPARMAMGVMAKLHQRGFVINPPGTAVPR